MVAFFRPKVGNFALVDIEGHLPVFRILDDLVTVLWTISQPAVVQALTSTLVWSANFEREDFYPVSRCLMKVYSEKNRSQH